MSSFSLPFPSFRQVLEVSDREPSRRNPFIPLHAGVIEGVHLGMPLPTPVVLHHASPRATCPVVVPASSQLTPHSSTSATVVAGGGDDGPPGGDGSKTQVGFDLPPSPPPASGPTPSAPVSSGISPLPNPGPGPNPPGTINSILAVNVGLDCAGGAAAKDDRDDGDAQALVGGLITSASSCGLNLMSALRDLVEAGFTVGRVVRSRLALTCVRGGD